MTEQDKHFDSRLLGIDLICQVFCLATKKTLEKSTNLAITYSKTLQRIPRVSLKPELGCFVQFLGDYSGLLVINFTAAAAVDLYRNYMLTMGMPESGLAREATSGEVVDTMGEITNQIMGRATRMAESKYDLSASFGQPKALHLSSAITLALESANAGITLSPDSTDRCDNRRIVFKVNSNRFHIELAMERTEFIVTSF